MRQALFCALQLVILLFISISPVEGAKILPKTATPTPGSDPHSYAQPEEALITHLDLRLTIDFDTKTLAGSAELHIDNLRKTTRLLLDTRDLTIRSISLDEAKIPTSWEMQVGEAHLGSLLAIAITPQTKRVHIDYATAPQAAALQWLSPAMTAGGKHPFLFTQSEAIAARSWVPCQDTPSVRFTYAAVITVPPGLTAVMSAENPQAKLASGVYTFSMPQKIPSYLLALAVGDLEFAATGPRTGVYAEPATLKAAAWEFGETETMVAAAEKIYGPYAWGRYDILVLPPAFPMGGMENPRLTFATPTVITGDRSLTSLIAHELAHSWSGNLVTNASWDDFWLNEGVTVYFEHRIMEAVAGKPYESMLEVLSMDELVEVLGEMGKDSPASHLKLNLKGRDPDEGLTAIAYEKGFFFLKMLENHFGRKKWDEFLRQYFADFKFQSMTSEKFLAYLHEKLLHNNKALAKKLLLDAWVYGPGIPANAPSPQSPLLKEVAALAQSFSMGAIPADKIASKEWTTHHWLYFLRKLASPLDGDKLAQLDRTFALTRSENSEILSQWLEIAISAQYQEAYPALERFLAKVGRLKFLKPLYTALNKTPKGKKLAQELYQRNRQRYHPLVVVALNKIR